MSKTGELSKLFEIDRTTLNYYVKTGLIQPSSEENQYHKYNFSDSMALAFIRYYRGLGFSTEEISALLCQDSNREKLARIRDKQQEVEQQLQILRFKQLLLENLQESLSFIEQNQPGPRRILTEPYYFVRKKDIEEDPFWMELYKMAPSVEFSAHYDREKQQVEIPDMFMHSGLSLKESWLKLFDVKPPRNSVYYPAEEKYVATYSLSNQHPGEDLSMRIQGLLAQLEEGVALKDDFVLYLFPMHYISTDGSFDCLCFFGIAS